MNLRKWHKKVAMASAPFFILTSLTGIALLFRKDGLYSGEMKSFLIGIHNWELGAKYIGAILALALIFVSISGFMIGLKSRKKS